MMPPLHPFHLVLCRCVSTLTLTLAATLARADLVDDTVEAALSRRNIPGMSIAVVDGGRIVKAQGYGVRELGKPDRVTPDTLFQAASISKPVSALGILRLIEERKISLDADVNAVLRSWQLPENEFTREQKATFRRILSHSAGLSVHGFGGYPVGSPLPTLLEILEGAPPANSAAIRVEQIPGSAWSYSGGGYTVLQQAVVDVSGRPYAEYMKQAVLEPMKMQASSFEQPLSSTRADIAASGYTLGSHPVPGRFHVYPELAAAGLWTTASDLARFAIGLQTSLSGQSNPVISAALTREMLTRQKNQSSLGFAVYGDGGSQRFEHGGRNEGFDCYLTAYLEKGKGAVIMMNANDGNGRTFREVLNAIAVQYDWPDYQRLPKHEFIFAFYEDYQKTVQVIALLVVVGSVVMMRRYFRRRKNRRALAGAS